VETATEQNPADLRTSRVDEWVKALSGSAFLWAFLPDTGSPASFVHRTFRREVWREAGVGGALHLCAGLLLWVPALAVLIGYCSWRCGAAIRSRTGKGIARQVLEQIGVAARHAIPPPWYYMFDLHNPARRARAAEYINRFETKSSLYVFLRKYEPPTGAPRTTGFLRDKSAFAEWCLAHGVAAVPALPVPEHGSIDLARIPELQKSGLFAKPRSGAGGRGAERWTPRGDGLYEGGGGRVLGEEALCEHLRELARRKPYVVRPLVENHPEVADLSSGALNTMRIYTGRNEHGGFEATHAVYRMAQGRNAVVDNFHAGGIAAPVDLETGELGLATDMGLTRDSAWLEQHPLTGARISGRRLPWWGEALDLARRAHAIFPDQAIIGWDVALLAGGPQLIEGNKSPDLDIVQRIHAGPVGNQRLGELLAWNLKRALAVKYGPQH
jgi:hypothetical protein